MTKIESFHIENDDFRDFYITFSQELKDIVWLIFRINHIMDGIGGHGWNSSFWKELLK
jgi:hypothetical protein